MEIVDARYEDHDITTADESEVRLRQMGLPFDREMGVELLKEIYL